MKDTSPIRAVFMDLDGTLLKNVSTVTQRTINAVQSIRKKGILPVITTGRAAYESDFVARLTGADGFLIAASGGQVYRDFRTHDLLYEIDMDEESYLEIISFLLDEKVFFETYIQDRGYCSKDVFKMIGDCGLATGGAKFYASKITEVDDILRYVQEEDPHVNKIFASVKDADSFYKLREKLDEFPGIYTDTSGWNYIEIVPHGSSKKGAVRDVRKALGLKKEQLMAIGDSPNDMGMFAESFINVAMGNGAEELKERADFIAPSNTDDGVAWALETLLLKE